MTAALGVLAATFSILLVWPQVWLSCKNRRTNGLSATACWLAAALNACWLLYGVLLHDLVQITTNAVVGAANTAILAALLVTQPALRTRRALLVTGWSAGALLAAAALSAVAVVLYGVEPVRAGIALGVLASLVGALQCLPQPVSLLRDRTQDLSGLSPARWWLTVASCLAWCGYGVANGQVAVWASATVGLGTALIVCGVLLTSRWTVPGQPIDLTPDAAVDPVDVTGRRPLALAA